MPPQRRSTLHGIHKKPAALQRMRGMLKKKPAAAGIRVKMTEVSVKRSWPVFGMPGYSFLKTYAERKEGDYHGIWYLVCKNSVQAGSQKNRKPFGIPLRLDIDRKDGRLSVNARARGGDGRHSYTRLLGLSFLYSCWNDDGGLLRTPRRITEAEAGNFEVHHLKERVRSCKLADLAVVSTVLHDKLTRKEIRSLPMPAGGQPTVPAAEH